MLNKLPNQIISKVAFAAGSISNTWPDASAVSPSALSDIVANSMSNQSDAVVGIRAVALIDCSSQLRRAAKSRTVDTPVKAEIARLALDRAGIPAVIEDSEIVAMDWLLANAVGGIKVKVREADAARAAEVLDAKLGADAGLASDAIDEDELTRQALAEAPEDEDR